MSDQFIITKDEIEYIKGIVEEVSDMILKIAPDDEEVRLSAIGLVGVSRWLNTIIHQPHRKTKEKM